MPWAAMRARPRGEVDRGPARALHLLRARAGQQLHHVRVGFDDDGRLLGLDVQILARQRRLHAVRDHRADHHLDPAARARTSPAPTGSSSIALHEHRHRHAVPRRRPAAGRASRWSGRWTRSPTPSGLDRTEVRAAQLHPARRVPVRPRADLPGRPAADLRLRRLPGVAGDAQGSWSAGTTSRRTATRRRAEGRRVGIGLAATSRAPASARTRAAHVQVETDRPGARRHRAHHPGPGPPDGRSRRSSPTSSACRSTGAR